MTAHWTLLSKDKKTNLAVVESDGKIATIISAHDAYKEKLLGFINQGINFSVPPLEKYNVGLDNPDQLLENLCGVYKDCLNLPTIFVKGKMRDDMIGDTEDIVLYLKGIGLDKEQSIKILTRFFDLGNDDPRSLVNNSKAWASKVDGDDNFQSEILDLIRKVR